MLQKLGVNKVGKGINGKFWNQLEVPTLALPQQSPFSEGSNGARDLPLTFYPYSNQKYDTNRDAPIAHRS